MNTLDISNRIASIILLNIEDSWGKTLKHQNGENNYYLILERNRNVLIDYIKVTYFKHSDYLCFDGNFIFGIIAPQVNAVLKEILITFDKSIYNIDKDITINNYYNIDKGAINGHIEKAKSNIIENHKFYPERLEETSRILREQVHTYLLPFFDKITSVEQINTEIIDKIAWREWIGYFPGETYLKAMIIMKLARNISSYKLFFDEYSEGIRNAVYGQGMSKYKSYYELLLYLDQYPLPPELLSSVK